MVHVIVTWHNAVIVTWHNADCRVCYWCLLILTFNCVSMMNKVNFCMSVLYLIFRRKCNRKNKKIKKRLRRIWLTCYGTKTLSSAAMWTPVFVFAMKIMLYGSKVQKKNVYHEDFCLVKICIPFCSVKICIQTRLPSALVQLICQ